MDFLKKYDARGAAEIPTELELRDQETGEVIMNGKKPCIVLVRGSSSRSVQESLRQEALERARKAKKASDDSEDTKLISDLHRSACESAARLIAGFANMETVVVGEDGKPEVNENSKPKTRPLGEQDIEAFLDLNFFSLAHAMRREDDNEWRRPSFAQQVIDAASRDSLFMGKSDGA